MQLSEVPLLRMEHQQLGEREFYSPHPIVGWMGALQAQDFPMAKWAIGLKSPGIPERQIDKTCERSKIIRRFTSDLQVTIFHKV
jgi:hypothetical protein